MIQILLMCHNCEDTVIDVLNSYKWADRICIFHTGSYDNTARLLNDFQKDFKKCTIRNIKFEGFSETRNKCLEMTENDGYMFSFFIDDSYLFVGDPKLFIKELNYYKKYDTLSIFIEGKDIRYRSSRIFKCSKKARFIGKIHEIINSKEDVIIASCYIKDIGTEKHAKRTSDRKKYDLMMLENEKDSRSAYYRACTLYKMYMNNECTSKEVIDAFIKRIEFDDDDKEEIFMCYTLLAKLYFKLGDEKTSVEWFLNAVKVLDWRKGECYFYAYIITGKPEYILQAYKYRYYDKRCRLPVEISIYSNDGMGDIELEYNLYKQSTENWVIC